MRRILVPLVLVFVLVLGRSPAGQDDQLVRQLILQSRIRISNSILADLRADPPDPKMFYLDALNTEYWPDESPCRLRLLLYNNLEDLTIDRLALTITSHDRNGDKLGTHDLVFRYVDPKKYDLAEARVPSSCRRLRFVRLRETTICLIDGKRYSDCIDAISLHLDFEWVGRYGG